MTGNILQLGLTDKRDEIAPTPTTSTDRFRFSCSLTQLMSPANVGQEAYALHRLTPYTIPRLGDPGAELTGAPTNLHDSLWEEPSSGLQLIPKTFGSLEPTPGSTMKPLPWKVLLSLSPL